MRRKSDLPELLAPAGSAEALYAAVAAGADAVYLGGKAFGARAYAKNFDADALADAVRYAHLQGVRVYVTVNVLIYDREREDALAYCAELYRMGVDAVIITDIGLIRKVRERIPDLELHASTQMSLHNTAGVRFAASLGMTRAVVARELPLADIRRVTEESPLEIEVFLHGALCVSHSGQCLFSSLVGGRSGNRGECAQPCRLPYNGGKYPLSLCDLCLAGHIRELCDAGVASLKIEGRMKSPDYVYRVTKMYRTLLDEHRDATEGELRELSRVFSRSGSTDGYFVGHPERPMTGVRTAEDKEATKALGEMTFAPTRVPVRASATFRLGIPSEMTIVGEKGSVTVYGEPPVKAQNSPLNSADLTTRLCKFGNTYLNLSPNDLNLTVEDGINLPPSAINALRRAAAEAYENTAREFSLSAPIAQESSLSTLPAEGSSSVLPEKAEESREKNKPFRTALFFSEKTAEHVADALGDFDAVFVPLFSFAAGGVANGVYLPPVVFEHEWESVRRAVLAAAEKGARYALVGNPGALELLEGTHLLPIGDFRLNITNRGSARFWRERGILRSILSPELTLPMLRDIGGGAIVSGRIPLMLTERCFVRENGGCDHCGTFAFTDRMGKKFPVLREYPHRNLILNAIPTYMGDKRGELAAARIFHTHFLFTVEGEEEVRRLLSDYRRGAPLSCEVRRIRAK